MLSKLGFLLLMIGCAGMDTPNLTVVIMVFGGLAIIAVSAFMERRRKYGISYRICQWKMPKLRAQSKRLVGVAFYIEV